MNHLSSRVFSFLMVLLGFSLWVMPFKSNFLQEYFNLNKNQIILIICFTMLFFTVLSLALFFVAKKQKSKIILGIVSIMSILSLLTIIINFFMRHSIFEIIIAAPFLNIRLAGSALIALGIAIYGFRDPPSSKKKQ